MEWAEDIIERLTSFTSEQQLTRQAEEGWREWFVNEGGEIDGWRVEDISGQFRNQMLCFESGLVSYHYFVTSLDLYGPGVERDEHIGGYRLITTLDGETMDDELELDLSKQEHLSNVQERLRLKQAHLRRVSAQDAA